MKSIGEQIKQARLKKGYSQETLASKLFLTKQSISKYENNYSIPSKDVMIELEKILDISLSKNKDQSMFNKKTLILSLVSVFLFTLMISTTVYFITYQNLKTNYQALDERYQELTYGYTSLEQSLNNKSSELEDKSVEYDELEQSYETRNHEYDNLYSDYHQLYSEHITLQTSFDELREVKTLYFDGLIITYTGNYSLNDDVLSMDIIITNTLDVGYLLKSSFFDIDGIASSNGYIMYNLNDGSSIPYWGIRTILPGEIYHGRLEATITSLDQYFETKDEVTLRFLGQRVSLIELKK